MVPVAVATSSAAPLGLLSTTVNVSVGSALLSLTVATTIVCSIVPARNCKLPRFGV